jgi:hypothetical protein
MAPPDVRGSAREDIAAAAKKFLAAAFRSLEEQHVLPPPRFQPYLAIGRDYFGSEVNATLEFRTLESLLSETFFDRFAEPLKRTQTEFASGYVFSLLEAAVALCALRREEIHPDSPSVDDAIASLIDRLATREPEVVCCRFVSHVTTVTGESLQLGDITVIPQVEGRDWRDYSDFVRLVPGAGAAFRPDPPFVHDHPHSILVARGTASDPFAIADTVSARIDRFLVLLRLLYAATAQSYFEVRGESSWVSKMRPRLVEYLGGDVMGPMMRRTVRLSEGDGATLGQVGDMLDTVEVNRANMAATSWDVALRNFSRAFVERTWPEQLIDLATALEALLSGTAKEDLTLRLRVRAAALLATDDDPGSTVFRDVRTLYDMRSRLVHGTNIKRKDVIKFARAMSTVPETDMHGLAVAQAVDRARDLVRRALLARLCLASGDEPEWPLTGDTPVDELLADDSERARWRSVWQQKMAKVGASWAAHKAPRAAEWLSDEGRE